MKLLIANRGEIAIRIARTARRMGIPTVAVYSEADRDAEFLRHADEAFGIGPAEPKASYLNVDRILEVAKISRATLVHPGYGFLSERPHFVRACEAAGIGFVGPTAENMEVMGDKIRARETCDRLGVPRVPGSKGAVASASEARAVAEQIGFPVLLKAAAGGGGKGMRRVDRPEDVSAAFDGATREALGAFGDGALYVEKYILNPHHIEVQVFGDGKGGALHLGERECSIQRRHQKVWEEAPSPLMERFSEKREALFVSALRIVQSLKYRGAGTLEFVADEEGRCYFLEMNTRLQVEHPVTEWVTGVDLVGWQIELATGKWKSPPLSDGGVPRRGAAIEARLYAEDPHSFLPAPGKLAQITLPTGPFVRSDSAYSEPGTVPVYYDPMISKVSVWGGTREEACGRMRVALSETRAEAPRSPRGDRLGGLRTNLDFLRRIAAHPQVLSGDTSTSLISDHPELTAERVWSEGSSAMVIAAAIFESSHSAASTGGVWIRTASQEGLRP